MGKEYPAIMNMPDVSEYYANEDFGMGDVEYNKQLLKERSEERRARKVAEPVRWGIWNELREEIIQQALIKQMEELEKKERKKKEKVDEKVSIM